MVKVPLIQRQLSITLSLLASIFFTSQIIQALAYLRNTVSPEVYLAHVALALAGFIFPIVGAWIGFGLIGGIVILIWGAGVSFFSATLSDAAILLWFVLLYGLLCFLLFRLDEIHENQAADLAVDLEKIHGQKNDLEISYKSKGEGISIFFEKYSTYYHLRKLAEELVTSLSVPQVSQVVVDRSMKFIPQGDLVLVSIADTAGQKLSVAASKTAGDTAVVRSKEGDIFDHWVIRNRKRLIVSDTHQDFRFDPTAVIQQADLRSLITVPLFNEGRVLGTLRINSPKPNTFSNDDLRLLDAIGTLASSALSNAMLYEKTEELAIRDSLTGLYVRRYFFDRLQQEHRRFLLSQRPISLLMCDLDHFKECNDRFGHNAGDLMLLHFSDILRATTEGAVLTRYGGEEFAILLPETPKEEAETVAETIRKTVEKSIFDLRRQKIKMTVSIGVASIPVDTLDTETLVQKADQALYQAKKSGRNRVCLSLS